jgi:purine nucleosidase
MYELISSYAQEGNAGRLMAYECQPRRIGRWLAAVLTVTVSAGAQSASHPDVIIDHDGGVDDLIAIALLMKSGAVRVRAVTICPADSYLEPATRATQLFLDRLGGRDIPVAQGHSEGVNPFPAKWRGDAGRVLSIPALGANAKPAGANPLVPDDAGQYLARTLAGNHAYTILETGPLTNVANALRANPGIKKNISRIFVMGGAVRVAGNVNQKGHDGSAEWNIFNQPQAAADVIGSGIPITIIPLDATNKAPLTQPFLDRLAAQPQTASQLAAQAWRLVLGQTGGDQYYFWDTLTAAALIDAGVVKTQRLKIRVITTGASEGRTVEDPDGSAIEVALDADHKKVEQMFLDILGK